MRFQLLFAIAIVAKTVASPVGAMNLDLSVRSSSDGYYNTFSGLRGATQAADYLTFGLVDSVPDCKKMCNNASKCKFVNTYHDVNGKNGSPKLTCSLFSKCHTKSDATNYGGQKQPNGKLNYIMHSDGWCRENKA